MLFAVLLLRSMILDSFKGELLPCEFPYENIIVLRKGGLSGRGRYYRILFVSVFYIVLVGDWDLAVFTLISRELTD